MRGKPGSPGFRAGRLRQAREALGLTAVSLAEVLSVSKQAIALYESGDRTPSPEILDKMSECLAMPREFFFSQEPPADPAPFFYRSLAATTKTARRKAEQRFGWLHEVATLLEERVELPRVQVSAGPAVADPAGILDEVIEELALELRRLWGMDDGPAPDLIALAERHGVIVSRFFMESDDLDAFSRWPASGRPFILLNADKDSAVRLRLDTAHEIGHQVLHRHLDPVILRRPEYLKLVEDQAFRFAGALLLPARSFLADVDAVSLEYLRILKPTWGASIGAMLKRLQHLEVLDLTEYQRLWRLYGMRGWRKREPLDDELKPERPRLLAQAVDMIGGPSSLPGFVRQRVTLPDRIYEELIGLPKGSVRGVVPPLPVRLRAGADDGSASTVVVPFQKQGRKAD